MDVTATNHFICPGSQTAGGEFDAATNDPEWMATSRGLTQRAAHRGPLTKRSEGCQTGVLQRQPGSGQIPNEGTNMTETDCEVGPEDNSFEPSAEGQQREGQID